MIDKLGSLNKLIYDVQGRTKTFFGISPVAFKDSDGYRGYQLGAYLMPWGEVYGIKEDRGIAVTGRGTGKSSIWQELNGADIACFMPYFLQVMWGESKPVPIDLVITANVKKNAKKRFENLKRYIRQNAFLEKELVDYNAWTKESVELRNGAHIYAEGASDNARGYHKRHEHGKVIYFLEEMAFWGGGNGKCMDSKDFVENIADQSMGAVIQGFTTPYGKRGGAWHFWNHPAWVKWQAPSWANPFQDRRKLARKKAYLKHLGRDVVIDQEMKGLFVDDAGLFFSNETWIKATNPNLEWMYEGSLEQLIDMFMKKGRQPGEFLLGIDPNKGIKIKSGDPIGINLAEKVGKRYINRLSVAINGKNEDELIDLFRLMFKNLDIRKTMFDAGGGYWKGLWTMFKQQNLTRNMFLIDPQGDGVVEYMTNLRTAMIMGVYEMPESEDLKESQQAMKGFGDTDESEGGDVTGKVFFQTDGKKSGIPCDLCAMGLSMAKERFNYSRMSPAETTEIIKVPESQITALEFGVDSGILGGDMNSFGAKLTGVGLN